MFVFKECYGGLDSFRQTRSRARLSQSIAFIEFFVYNIFMNNKFGLNFNNAAQEIFFSEFYDFLLTLGCKLDISIKDNTALLSLPGEFPRMAVFPYENDGLHFEFSLNFNKDFDTNNSIPFFVTSNYDLRIAKLFSKYVLFLNSQTANKPASAEGIKRPQQKPSDEPKEKVIKIDEDSSSLRRHVWSYF